MGSSAASAARRPPNAVCDDVDDDDDDDDNDDSDDDDRDDDDRDDDDDIDGGGGGGRRHVSFYPLSSWSHRCRHVRTAVVMATPGLGARRDDPLEKQLRPASKGNRRRAVCKEPDNATVGPQHNLCQLSIKKYLQHLKEASQTGGAWFRRHTHGNFTQRVRPFRGRCSCKVSGRHPSSASACSFF